MYKYLGYSSIVGSFICVKPWVETKESFPKDHHFVSLKPTVTVLDDAVFRYKDVYAMPEIRCTGGYEFMGN